MKTLTTFLAVFGLVCGICASTAFAQRGMGDSTGVARQAVKPEIVKLSGKLVEIKTGPCEMTTGRSPIGTHLILETEAGEKLNIHLGPVADVADTVAKLSAGLQLSVKAFRTEKMPDSHYTAQSLSWDKSTVELRDAGLRPVWAGQGGGRGRGAVATANTDTTPPPPDGRGQGRRGGGPPWAGGRGWGGGGWGGGGWGGGGWGGGGWGGGGRGADATFQADREVFHSLLDDHKQIHRTVTQRADGVETLTESDDPKVAQAIQSHATAMHERLKKIQPIHMRDPLFAAIFAQASKITMKIENTNKGVRVVETSTDPYTVKLIQAHAEVVSKFVANGFSEARQNHEVPEK